MSAKAEVPVSRKRIRLFKFIGLLLPLLVLLLLEGGLRLFHYGQDQRLFITAPEDARYFVMNPDAAKQYFPDQEIATTGNHELFRKEKDPNTCRIFVLGESTTIGYPYFHNGSFHRWLQYRLAHTYPNKNFEIINVALTAVNSYTVLGFAKQVVHYQPDAVLIYSGHNEYYGALGVGSTEKIGGSPALVYTVLALRRLRVMQLFTNVYESLIKKMQPGAKDGKARMELMVARQQIAYGSDLYQRGIDQFKANMDATLQVFENAGVPVFVSNLVANERDLPPFISLPVDSARYPNFGPHFRAGMQAMATGDSTNARTNFQLAEQAFAQNADCNFYLGKLALWAHDSAAAPAFFARARDMDALRFRAPAAMNQVLAAVCAQHRQAHLVDAYHAFAMASAAGVPGNNLVLEHVHPNLDGYALLSDVFYQSLRQQGILPVPAEPEMTLARLRTSMPITAVDSLAGTYKIANLKRSWPFHSTNVNDSTKIEGEVPELAYGLAFRHLSWAAAMDQLYAKYVAGGDLPAAARIAEARALESPTDARLALLAANLYGKMDRLADAAFYFRQAFNVAPDFETARNIFVIYLKQDEPMKAMPYLDYAMAHNDRGMNLVPVKQFANAVIQLQLAAQKSPQDADLLKQIATKYYQMGNTDGAVKYLELALKASPADVSLQHMLAQLKKA